MSGLGELLKLREEQNKLLVKIWSPEGKVKVRRTFVRDGKSITQTFWTTPKQAQALGLKPIEEPKVEEPKKFDLTPKLTENAIKWKSRLSKEAQSRWTEYAKKLGITEEQLKNKVVEKIQPLVNSASIRIRFPSFRLTALLHDGRFKNISETKRPSPGKQAKFEEYFKERTEAENKMFGLTDEDTTNRPVYGYLTSRPDGRVSEWLGDTKGSIVDSLSSYGNVRVKIKNEVRPRTTVTESDSLDINYIQLNPTSPGVKPEIRQIPYPIDKIGPEVVLGDILDITKNFKTVNDVTPSYMEAQIHNGLDLSDIEEIVFEIPPNETIKNALEKKGIKYRIMAARKEPMR